MKITRLDKENGREEVIDWAGAILALSNYYSDLTIVRQALLDGEVVQTNFATYRLTGYK